MADDEQETPNEGTEGRAVSRRHLMAGAAGLFAGAVAAEAAGAAAAGAATPDTPPALLLGQENIESETTSLANETTDGINPAALQVYTDFYGETSSATLATPWVGVIGATGTHPLTQVGFGTVGVVGVSPHSTGMLGAVGVEGVSGLSAAAGVVGYAGSYGGLTGGGGAGVVGFTDSYGGLSSLAGAGVLGVVGFGSYPGYGVVTASALPAGVQGVADGPGGVGVEAVNADNGLALNVLGNVSFSTSGHATVAKAVTSVEVPDPGVSIQSLIFVSFTNNPHGAAVSWVERQPGVGFTVHLTAAPSAATAICYFRIN